MNNNTITWNYAVNFDENEKVWNELKIVLLEKMRVITKNVLLTMTMTMMDECTETAEIIQAIDEGDRTNFLFKKAKESAESAANLEEAGNLFVEAFSKVLNKNLNEQNDKSTRNK